MTWPVLPSVSPSCHLSPVLLQWYRTAMIPKMCYKTSCLHVLLNKDPSSQGYGFSSSHGWMWELECEESWAPKNWCFWTVLLEKTLESPVDCQGDPTSPSKRISVLSVHWKDWCWSWNSNTLATWCEQLTHLKRPDCPLNSKEIQPVHSEGDQPWDFFGRNDAKVETPVLWPPHAKSWLIGKDFDAGRDWGQEKKGMTEDEMAGWHHRLDGR